MSLLYLVGLSIRTPAFPLGLLATSPTPPSYPDVPTPEHSRLHCGGGDGSGAGPHGGSLLPAGHCSHTQLVRAPHLYLCCVGRLWTRIPPLIGCQSPRCCYRSGAFMPKVGIPDVFQLCSVCPAAWSLLCYFWGGGCTASTLPVRTPSPAVPCAGRHHAPCRSPVGLL